MRNAEVMLSAVKRMVAAASGPSRVILFGSCGRGIANEDALRAVRPAQAAVQSCLPPAAV